jgi:hypothetical protein
MLEEGRKEGRERRTERGRENIYKVFTQCAGSSCFLKLLNTTE